MNAGRVIHDMFFVPGLQRGLAVNAIGDCCLFPQSIRGLC